MTFGYQALHVPDQWFPFGLNVDGARNFGAFSLVGEVGWALTTDDGEDDDNDEFDADVSQHLWHFAAGARWHGRSAARVWPFAQVLAGAAYLRSSVNDVTDSATKFMLQPGAGVVMVAGDGWGIVGQVDYRRIFLDEDEDGESGQNQFRVFVGIRLILD
jgi:hypothetical protein